MNKTEIVKSAAGLIVGIIIISSFRGIGMLELPEDYDPTQTYPSYNLTGILYLLAAAFIVLIIFYFVSRTPEKEKDADKK